MRTLGKTLLFCSALTLATAPPLLAAGDGQTAPQASPAAPATKPQTRCPVMGGPIDKSLYVDVKGKRIYLCCAACEDAVRAEPDKYIQQIEKRGEHVEDLPAASSPPAPDKEKARH